MANSTYNSTEGKINQLQSLKSKTKLKLSKNINIYYDEMNIRRRSGNCWYEEDHFSKNVKSFGKFCHEVLLLMKFLQTKPKVMSMNIIYYDLFYTVI